ncbi:MAG: hypothetical protein DRG30_01400 [Epsilonproteobacteria bacterium]|nr:MAG: hypothetical protein DRG30_01400 [Campylobacterota bacterium]
MQELVIKSTLPTIEGNFEVVKQQLIDGLRTYDVIITAETVKDGKSMASEINKIKKAIKDQQTKALEDILGPVDGFKEKIKELMDLADEAKEKITKQVAAYEEKTKQEILDKIREFALNEINESNLREPFRNIETADLMKLGAVTKTGNLTTATINTIKARITEQLNFQFLDDKRISDEQIEKDREIERIREEERIKAEAKLRDEEAKASTPPEAFQAPAPIETINMETGEILTEPYYEDHYPEGEYSPPHEEVATPMSPPMQEDPLIGQRPMTRVKVLVDFDIDITKIPNITDQQIIDAMQKKLNGAGINNAVIRDLQRF